MILQKVVNRRSGKLLSFTTGGFHLNAVDRQKLSAPTSKCVIDILIPAFMNVIMFKNGSHNYFWSLAAP